MTDNRPEIIKEFDANAKRDLLEEIEQHFLDRRHSQYRFEISKKYWSKLKNKYG